MGKIERQLSLILVAVCGVVLAGLLVGQSPKQLPVVEVVPKAPSKVSLELWEHKIKKGETFSHIFRKMGLEKRESLSIQKKAEKYFPKILHPGQKVIAELYTEPGPFKVRSLALETRDKKNLHFLFRPSRKAGNAKVLYAFDDLAFRSDTSRISLEVANTIEETLIEEMGSPEVVKEVMAIWSWDEEFAHSEHAGDSLDILIEKVFDRYDRFHGYGRVLAARCQHGQLDNWAFNYSDGNSDGYFNTEGKSIQGFLMKAPLQYTLISSHFSSSRLHPTTGRRRPHWGVDYAAPYGTEIYAAGDGHVEYSKWVRGYGKTVKIKHSGEYNTYYSHLKSYAEGVEPGDTVVQGQLIGYVGTTGLTTGPHLHYSVERNGRYINPRTLAEEKQNIPQKEWQQFSRVVEGYQMRMGYQDMSLVKNSKAAPAVN